jgi:enamine deaminase RidA (YjgF/YER057c/UK114 family)
MNYEKQLEKQNEQLRERLETVLQDATMLAVKLVRVESVLNHHNPSHKDKRLAVDRVKAARLFLQELSQK